MGASDFSGLPHIGEAVKRKEDYRFLTGAGNYTDDIVLANQAYCVFVRSPHAHATIDSIARLTRSGCRAPASSVGSGEGAPRGRGTARVRRRSGARSGEPSGHPAPWQRPDGARRSRAGAASFP